MTKIGAVLLAVLLTLAACGPTTTPSSPVIGGDGNAGAVKPVHK